MSARKYEVEINFDLATSIEFDGSFDFDYGDAEDVDERPSYDSGDVNVTGNTVTFTVEAENEDDAESKAYEVVSDGNEVNDGNGVYWSVDNVYVEVTAVEMTLDDAFALLRDYDSDSNPEDVAEAIKLVLDHVETLKARIAALEAKLVEANKELAEIKEALPTPPVTEPTPVPEDRPF